jgi:acetyl esterase/lipase
VGQDRQDKPFLSVFQPPHSSPSAARPAVLVLPGGAYIVLATDHEGRQIADWLNAHDVVAFVLTYRLAPRYRYPAQFDDATRALRWIRSHAAEYDVDPGKIGIWGFSAGGHLASLVGTHFDAGNPSADDPVDRASSRPDFMVLAYPVIEQFGHAAKFSYESLLGPNPAPSLVDLMQTDHHIRADSPPTFLFHTDSDDAVLPNNSAAFYLALKRAGVPAELHIYAKGPHGVGLASGDPVLRTWPDRLADWLRLRGVLPQSESPH